jgi:hypothetical protein
MECKWTACEWQCDLSSKCSIEGLENFILVWYVLVFIYNSKKHNIF